MTTKLAITAFNACVLFFLCTFGVFFVGAFSVVNLTLYSAVGQRGVVFDVNSCIGAWLGGLLFGYYLHSATESKTIWPVGIAGFVMMSLFYTVVFPEYPWVVQKYVFYLTCMIAPASVGMRLAMRLSGNG